ncbi:unnamed protein product [Caenorhabditis bovis]|uniref:Vesicle transport protein n=1 Tax=Caenorhabditis bovis TaxID=2654633 RepID=A0A8S1F9Z8_9PELO|nr:unnamed protein product [Caenorhabditis bovis]
MFGSMQRGEQETPPIEQDRRELEQQSTMSTGMSWEIRVQCFIGLFVLSVIASLCGSFLLVRTKITGFCIMTSFSAILSLSSTCFLMGPIGQIKKMFDKSRWIASTIYLLMIASTLISGLYLNNSALAITCTIGQYIAMAWYSLSYIPYAREALARVFC